MGPSEACREQHPERQYRWRVKNIIPSSNSNVAKDIADAAIETGRQNERWIASQMSAETMPRREGCSTYCSSRANGVMALNPNLEIKRN
jgi:hypothetical protein